VIVVKQVVQVRLLPTPEQASALAETLHACNTAASWLSEQMHTCRVWRKFDVQKRFHPQLREKFGPAQPAIRVIGKTVGAYTTLRGNLEAGHYGPPGSERRRTVEASPIMFRPIAAQPFDARCWSWQFGDPGRDGTVSGRGGTVSIWTVAWRLRTVRPVGNPHHLLLLRSRTIGETDLIHRGGQWLPHATIDAPQAPAREPNGFLGVDLGIVNIATTSDGHRSTGSHLTRYRKRQQRIRT
jgi:putative transposase